MERFFDAIVRHPKTVIIVFAVLFVLGLFGRRLVSVNYDMNDYLPADSPSTVALNVMQEEFDTAIPNVRVMIEDVSLAEALDYKARLAAIDGVTDVLWLDDAADIHQPLEILDEDTIDDYYRNGAALYTVTVDASDRIATVAAIRELIGPDNAMTGSAVSTAVATESTVEEIAKIAAFIVLFVLLVLIVTTNSLLEPLLIPLGLGVSVVINGGSNLIFGEISFVTNAAGSILQLAISLDFAVFLLHRYHECHRPDGDAAADMAVALRKAGVAILSSGLTVMIGFSALAVMRFGIGPDLGLALAKGIAISLITVFTFLPALLVATDKMVLRTGHRHFLPDFEKFGRVVCKLMVPVFCLFILLPIPCYLAAHNNEHYFGASHIFGAGTTLGDETARIDDIFGISDTYVLLVPRGDLATEAALSSALQTLPQVDNVISFVDKAGAEVPVEYLDPGTQALLFSEHYSRLVVTVAAEYESGETFELVKKIRAMAEEHYPGGWYLAGEGVSTYDLMDTITADGVRVDLIAVGAVFLVLLLATGSLSLPVLLVLAIETAIWLNFSIPYFQGQTVFYLSYLIVSAVQLGATVDYAILFADRYKEARREMDKKSAIRHTVTTVTVPILTSGSALVVCGFLLSYMTTHGILSQLGFFLGRGTVFSLLSVLFVLPAMLYFGDGLIQKTTLHTHFYKSHKEESHS